jgi:hypothetical protein
LKDEVAKIFRSQWTTRNGYVVPDPDDAKLGNDAVVFEKATVLYADLSGSTAMVVGEVRPLESAVLPLGLVEDWDVRLDPALMDEPGKVLGGTIGAATLRSSLCFARAICQPKCCVVS